MTETATQTVEASPTALVESSPTPQEGRQFTPTPEAPATESAPRVSPYVRVMVEGVDIRYLETRPVQVELVIRGTLPDQCQYDFYSVENRGGQNIKVTLFGIHPADSCEQTSQGIETTLLLGRDMPESERGFAPGDYTLMVNNYQTTFSVRE